MKEPEIECQDCLWCGRWADLIAPFSSDEPHCPNCDSIDFLEIAEERVTLNNLPF